MKGISPVIATVLLLLMAVAAVGGSWVWYQRQSALVGGQTEEKINEQIEQQTGVSVTLASVYLGSTNNISLLVNNGATASVNVTGFKITAGSTTTVNMSIQEEIIGKTTGAITTLVSCTSGDKLTIQLFAAGISTQNFDDKCP